MQSDDIRPPFAILKLAELWKNDEFDRANQSEIGLSESVEDFQKYIWFHYERRKSRLPLLVYDLVEIREPVFQDDKAIIEVQITPIGKRALQAAEKYLWWNLTKAEALPLEYSIKYYNNRLKIFPVGEDLIYELEKKVLPVWRKHYPDNRDVQLIGHEIVLIKLSCDIKYDDDGYKFYYARS